MPPSDQLQDEIQTLRTLVAGTRPSQLAASTPCAKWDVKALINHFVGGAGMFAAAFRGDEIAIDPDAPMPDLVGDDPAASFDAAIKEFTTAVDQPGAMDRTITLPFGSMPAPVVLEILKFDLTVHAWDLAIATGQKFEPSDELVARAHETARQILVPEARDGDTFAAEVTPPPNAKPIEKLVAFAGREV